MTKASKSKTYQVGSTVRCRFFNKPEAVHYGDPWEAIVVAIHVGKEKPVEVTNRDRSMSPVRLHYNEIIDVIAPPNQKREEHIEFITNLAAQLRDSIIRDIRSGKVPEEWDGIELRWLLSERAETHFGQDQKRRRKEFDNTCIINNL